MKIMKWLGWILGIVLILGLIAAAGLTGYRIGLAQGASGNASRAPSLGRSHNFNGSPNWMNRNNRPGYGIENHGFGFGFGRGRGRMPFFAPFFWLAGLVVLALIVWLGFMAFKNSGWQFVRVSNASAQSEPVPEPTPQVSRGRKKKTEE